MGSGFAKRKKQMAQFQKQIAKMQEDMQNKEVHGRGGHQLVQVVLSGDKTLKKISIDPTCVDPEDVQGLEDLIYAAFQDAYKQLEESAPVQPDLDNFLLS